MKLGERFVMGILVCLTLVGTLLVSGAVSYSVDIISTNYKTDCSQEHEARLAAVSDYTNFLCVNSTLSWEEMSYVVASVFQEDAYFGRMLIYEHEDCDWYHIHLISDNSDKIHEFARLLKDKEHITRVEIIEKRFNEEYEVYAITTQIE